MIKDFFMRTASRRDVQLFVLMLILVPLAGEPRFYPFGNDLANFRVSFGSPIFLLFLLVLRHTPRWAMGLSTGVSVLLFRTMLSMHGGMDAVSALLLNVPGAFYYLVFAFCFALPPLVGKTIYEQCLSIVFWSVLTELCASLAQMSCMNLLAGTFFLPTLIIIGRLLLIASLRCIFILSFFFLFQLYTMETQLDRRTRERDRLSILISGLYEEVFQLKLSLHHAEQATHDCYQLYETITEKARSDESLQPEATELLRIAGVVHDIKKDNQRIYAGLSELTVNRHVDDYLPLEAILRILLHAQKKYVHSLHKAIRFETHYSKDLPDLHVFTLLSMLNNLVANAIEAIRLQGAVIIHITREGEILHLRVHNLGSFIPERRLKQIFRPGYTTKFDASGKASSGVGLSYVREQTDMLGGSIEIRSDGANTVTCDLLLPLAKLTQNSTPIKEAQS